MTRGLCCPDNQKHCCGSWWFSIGSMMAVAGLVLYFTLGLAIQTKINSAVTAALVLDAAAIAKPTYVQTSTTFNAYAFNCTNALAVQTTGAVPIVVQVGPYVYTKTVNKYEVGLTNSGTTVQYKSWTQYTMAPGSMAGVDTVVTPNNLYVGAIGSLFGTQVGMQAALTATVWNKLRGIYQYDAGAVLTAVRVLTFPVYFNTLLEAVTVTATAAGLTNPSASNAAFVEAAVKLQWANKQSTAGGATALDAIITAKAATLSAGVAQSTLTAIAGLSVGFEAAPYATVLPLSDAQALLLLDSTATAAISLRSPVGIAKWLSFLTSATSTNPSGVTYQVELITALQAAVATGSASGAQAFAAVAGYLGAKATNAASTASTAYLSAVVKGLAAANGMGTLTGADLPASWSDVGALQFAQGWVVRALTAQTKSSMSALGLPGLAGTSEWYSYCSGTPAQVAANICPMNLVQAQAVLNLVSGVTSNADIGTGATAVPTAATALVALWQATLGVASGSVTPAQFSASYGTILGVYSTSGSSASSFTAFFGALTAFIFDQGPLRGVGLSQTERLSLIMGNSAGANLRSDGTTTTNGGVFVRRTIDEILLGYVAPDPLTSITGKGYNGPFGPRYTSQSDFIAQYATMNAGTPMGTDVMPTVVNAALGGFTTVGSFVSSVGVKAVVTRNDLNQPCPATGSCSVWATAEPVTGMLDGAAMPPLRQDEAAYPAFGVFDSAVTYRNLPFVAASPIDTTVKGIKTRRYIVDPLAWKNASSVPANANYRQIEGDGLLPIASVKQGAPIYITQPHFTDADATLVQAKVRGLTPDTTGSGRYQFYLDIDPITGRTMQAFKRVQVNVGLSKAMLNRPDIAGTYLAAGTIFMPSFWGEETAVISDADAASFVTALYTPANLGVALPIALLVVGLLLLVAGLVCLGLGASEMASEAAAGGGATASVGVAMTSIATKAM